MSFEELQLLFDEISVLGISERRARLAQLRQQSPELSTQLTGLLDSDEVTNATDVLDGMYARLIREARPMPKAIGRYEILQILGEGGMGRVYLARHPELGREVALKVIRVGAHADDEDQQRFAREARATAKLEHPNIVQVYDYGEHEGQPFFTMALVSGESLAEVVAAQVVAPGEAARMIRQVAVAMHYAHGEGLIHRDIKPANIQLDGDGNARVTDFGLVRMIGVDSVTSGSSIVGTPWYMAPEQAAGEVSVSVDIYAIGATLYHLLTGRPPFQAATPLETIEQARSTEPVPPRRLNPEIPIDLETICLVCLEKSPAARYESAGDLAEDLGHFLADEPISRPSYGPLRRSARWARRRWRLIGAAVAITAAVGVALLAQIQTREQERERRLTGLVVDAGQQAQRIDAICSGTQRWVDMLATSARQALLSGKGSNPQEFFFSEYRGVGKKTLPTMAFSRRYQREVCTEHALMKMAPKMKAKGDLARFGRLQHLLPLMKDVMTRNKLGSWRGQRVPSPAELPMMSEQPLIWCYVSLPVGLHFVYPAHRYPLEYDPTSRPWYDGAVDSEGELFWTWLYGDAGGQGMVLTCSRAFYGPKGKLLGVVGIDIDPNFLRERMALYANSTAETTMLIDGDGRVRLRASGGPPPANWQAEAQEPQTMDAQYREVRKAIVAGKPAGLVTTARGELVSFTRLRSWGWYYVVVVDREQLLGK